jgi:hypothetical protein
MWASGGALVTSGIRRKRTFWCPVIALDHPFGAHLGDADQIGLVVEGKGLDLGCPVPCRIDRRRAAFGVRSLAPRPPNCLFMWATSGTSRLDFSIIRFRTGADG